MDKSTGLRGRPRSDDSRAAILKAAFEILREKGYGGMGIETVAERAGVGKATIYRWWEDRATLAVEAFFVATEEELRFPDTGSVKENFRQQILQLGQLLRSPVGMAFVGMTGGAKTDPAVHKAMRERWIGPRRKWGIEQMTRAIEAGECWPDVDIEAALSALYSPLYSPLLLGLGTPGAAQIEKYLAVVLRGIFRG